MDVTSFAENRLNSIYQRTTYNYRAPEMVDSSLPFEIVEVIVDKFTTEHRITAWKKAISVKFLPQWYLVPLLRVCKLWHTVTERFLYRSISVGSGFPDARVRQAYKIPRRLVTTLAANSRLAALVEELRLGIEDVTYRKSLDWTQRNIRILRICPNVKHVTIRGFNFSLQDALTDVLKEKSLVSFRITTRFLSSDKMYEVRSLKLFELIQRWQNLRSIRIEGFMCITELHELRDLEAPDFPFRCLELQEIVIYGDFDCGNIGFLRYLHGITGVVKMLRLRGDTSFESKAAMETFSRCIRAWSRTLEWLYLDFGRGAISYTPLWDALSSLDKLRALFFSGQPLDFGSIANLPQLRQLGFLTPERLSKKGMGTFFRYLEDKQTFTALKFIWMDSPFSHDLFRSQVLQHRNIVVTHFSSSATFSVIDQ